LDLDYDPFPIFLLLLPFFLCKSPDDQIEDSTIKPDKPTKSEVELPTSPSTDAFQKSGQGTSYGNFGRADTFKQSQTTTETETKPVNPYEEGQSDVYGGSAYTSIGHSNNLATETAYR
jgi:hypothetical protein